MSKLEEQVSLLIDLVKNKDTSNNSKLEMEENNTLPNISDKSQILTLPAPPEKQNDFILDDNVLNNITSSKIKYTMKTHNDDDDDDLNQFDLMLYNDQNTDLYDDSYDEELEMLSRKYLGKGN